MRPLNDEPTIVAPSFRPEVKPAEGWGFLIDVGEAKGRSSLTSAFGHMFNGVVFPEGCSIENRMVGLFMCQEWMLFLNKIGWYEHTADWDLYAQITLYDGSWTENNGVFLTLSPEVHPNTYAGDPEVEPPTHAVLKDCYLWSEASTEERSFWNQCVRGLNVVAPGEDPTGDLYVPIEKIARVHVGWA